MEIRRHHILAFIALHVLMAVAWMVHVWPRAPVGFITAEGAMICPSPDSLQMATARPSMAEGLRCQVYPAGVRMQRGVDTGRNPPGVWWVHEDGNVERRGWGWRRDLRMPDGSAVVDAAAA